MTDVTPAQILRWEAPPPPTKQAAGGGQRFGSRWAPVAQALVSRPGEWALIAEGMKSGSAMSLAGLVRRGSVVCFEPRGDFDACTRSVGSVAKVYARFVGDGGAV